MSKLVTITTAVVLSAAAASPVLAKTHHHHHHNVVAAAEPQQVLFPSPLIGGPEIRVGNSCYTVHNSDWGAGFSAPCPAK